MESLGLRIQLRVGIWMCLTRKHWPTKGQITYQTSRIVRERIILNATATQETMLAGQEEDGSSKK
ncbi:hypothetical protein CN311_31640 [Mesorhizobium sanjuanii]|uniref:Uncharacterized protein n=1 Tax=Mesorhizobium sanjuanii TaxID=2037900 RepID=A0A2A6F5A8_9HYPH|nr:hypothetical protein CN311_31640 [Mesorhizobium sanjuanii]